MARANLYLLDTEVKLSLKETEREESFSLFAVR